MAEEQAVRVDLGDGVRMVIVAEQIGPTLVADGAEIVATLEKVSGSIERIGRSVLDAAKRASPSKASVELSFGLAIEQGQLVALFGKGKAEATITVNLEWDRTDGD
jgi:hypothetical protein